MSVSVRSLGARALICALLSTGAQAQAQTLPASAATTARLDLADGYLRMDRAYANAPASLPDSTRAAINKQFDRSTFSFFAGKYTLALAQIDSATAVITGGVVTPAPPRPSRVVRGRMASMWRDEFLQRLSKLDTAGRLAQAMVSVRARAQLLVDAPSRERSAEFLSDPVALVRDLTREVGALERGLNPYVGQAGDAWHVFRGAGGALIPMRIVAPEAAASSSAPVPVLIALHGAGADENIFPNAYGQGVAAQMALAANTILVAPFTNEFMRSPANFDSLMLVLRSRFRVNDARIYVLGHSMGAGVASQLAQTHGSVIAAIACIAGGAAVSATKVPPILFIGAAVDPIVPAARVKLAASGTAGSVYRELANEGHTLMIGNAIRMAVPWLLEHRP